MNLTSNFFLSFILLALAEIPGIFATKLHDNFGRKPTAFFATSVLGMSCLAAAFVKNGTFVTVLSMVGKAASTLVFGVLYQVHQLVIEMVLRVDDGMDQNGIVKMVFIYSNKIICFYL